MLDVYITVDTEIWPRSNDLSPRAFARDFDRDFYGRTGKGNFGVGYQLDVLDRYGLKGVYLVESLFVNAVGPQPLREIVESIQGRGHDVQLHLHTEWLPRMATPLLGERRGQHVRNFSEEEQTILIRQGLENLRACGAEKVNGFRAGNFGANRNTLRALANNGVPIDSSYSACGRACRIDLPGRPLLPCRTDGVLEIPVTYFRDAPGHYRPLHLTACSFGEIKHALLAAWRRGWRTFVIVSHSFELLNRSKDAPDPVVVRRYERMCRFLAEHPDKFRTATFEELGDGNHLVCDQVGEPPASAVWRTAWRYGEQLTRRSLF